MFDFFDNQSTITRNLESHEIAKSLHSRKEAKTTICISKKESFYCVLLFKLKDALIIELEKNKSRKVSLQ